MKADQLGQPVLVESRMFCSRPKNSIDRVIGAVAGALRGVGCGRAR